MKKFASMQSFFLAFIIYSSLAFSLLLSFFFWDAFDHFSSLFWCVVSLPLFALEDKTRNIIPPKETHPAAFSPAHTLQVRDFSPRKRLFLSHTLVRSVVYPFLVFSGRYIYSHILLLLSLFGDPRERVRVEKSSHRGDEIRFFRYSFLCAFLFFRETLLQLETLDTI